MNMFSVVVRSNSRAQRLIEAEQSSVPTLMSWQLNSEVLLPLHFKSTFFPSFKAAFDVDEVVDTFAREQAACNC